MPRIGTPDFATTVPSGRQITAGVGLLGGGDLTADRDLAVDFGEGHNQVRHADDPIVAGPRAWELYSQTVGPGPGQVPKWNTATSTYQPGDFTAAAHAATHAAAGPDPVSPASIGAVALAARAAPGGFTTIPYAAVLTLDALLACHQRIVATGSVSLNPPVNGTDTQRLLIEIHASTGPCTVSISPSVEVSGAAPNRSTSIPSGKWGYVALLRRETTWRLVGMDPPS